VSGLEGAVAKTLKISTADFQGKYELLVNGVRMLSELHLANYSTRSCDIDMVRIKGGFAGSVIPACPAWAFEARPSSGSVMIL